MICKSLFVLCEVIKVEKYILMSKTIQLIIFTIVPASLGADLPPNAAVTFTHVDWVN